MEEKRMFESLSYEENWRTDRPSSKNWVNKRAGRGGAGLWGLMVFLGRLGNELEWEGELEKDGYGGLMVKRLNWQIWFYRGEREVGWGGGDILIIKKKNVRGSDL